MDPRRVQELGGEARIGLWLPTGIERHRPAGRSAWHTDSNGGLHPMSTAGKNIEIPDFSLVVLIGSTGSGKSTFATKHFLPTEVISSDHCRALVSDSEADQGATGDAFDLVSAIAGKRLKHR